MDFTLMIVYSDWARDGSSVTSQQKAFPTRELADQVADALKAKDNGSGHIHVLKLYI